LVPGYECTVIFQAISSEMASRLVIAWFDSACKYFIAGWEVRCSSQQNNCYFVIRCLCELNIAQASQVVTILDTVSFEKAAHPFTHFTF
jgi:hypothetical protein